MKHEFAIAQESRAFGHGGRNADSRPAFMDMALDPNDFIRSQIRRHGRLRAARYLTCSEYSIEHDDGFAYVVADPRAAIDGPIRSVELTYGHEQTLTVDFEQRMTSQRFSTNGDRAPPFVGLSPGSVLEMA